MRWLLAGFIFSSSSSSTGAREVAELLSYRLVIIAFSVGVDAEGDLLAIHVSQPILTDFERSALDVHQSGITVAEGVQTDALNSLLDA